MSVERRPTIREVAARAGVSIGTVSNVLTGRHGVAPATRVQVERAIVELGFEPDPAARTLIRRRPRLPPAADPATPRLTCVGYACADFTARVAVLPHRDDRARAETITKTLGGCAANVAVTAAGLGPPLAVTAEVLTRLGTDSDSDWAEQVLAQRHVALVQGSRRPGERLSRCLILVEANGARTIINEPLQVEPQALAAWLADLPQPLGRHALHIQGDQLTPLARLLPRARAAGLMLSTHTARIGAAWRSAAGLRRLARLVDLIVLDRETARAATGALGGTADLVARLARFARPGAAELVLTLGSDGAVLLRAGHAPVQVPAPVRRPVDTTGASDTLVGCLLAARLNDVPSERALGLAVAGASRSIESHGAQEHGLVAADLVESAIGI